MNACEETRKYLDSYVSSELLVETNHELLRDRLAAVARSYGIGQPKQQGKSA